MSAEKDNKIVAAKILELGKRVEEYEIAEGIAIYRGAPVDYKKIKIMFQIRVNEVLIENKTNPTATTTLISTLTSEVKKDVEKSKVAKEKDKEKTEKETSTLSISSEEEDFDKKIEDLGVLNLLQQIKVDEKAYDLAEKIAIFFNINGTSKTRTNLLVLNEKSYTMNDIASILQLSDKTRGEKERTNREDLTVERISAAYAEETSNFLKKYKKMIKIKNLGHLGFTKSFFCKAVINDRNVARQVYKEYILYAKSWKGGNPMRFAEKMKVYFTSYCNYSPAFFKLIEDEIEKEQNAGKGGIVVV